MKIGIVTTWFERGAAYVSKQFMSTFKELGHEVYIYARGGEAFAKNVDGWDTPDVTWSPFLYSTVPTDIDKKHFEDWLNREQIDAVLFNEQHYFSPVLWTKELGIPAIAYIDYYTKETVELFSIYDQIWCNTQRHMSVFERFPGAKYIPWGTDCDLYQPDKNTCNKRIKFFHSSGMNPYRKGTDLFIRALDIASESNSDKLSAVIHTQVSLEENFPELKSVIQHLISKGILEIVEKTITAPGLYNKMDVYVYPTRLEGIGLTIAEAISSGLPVIVPNESPMKEFVSIECASLTRIKSKGERQDGYYWPEAEVDVFHLSEQLSAFSSLEHKEIRSLKEKARLHAIERLDFSKNMTCISEHLSILKLTPASDKEKHKVRDSSKKFSKIHNINPTMARLVKKVYKAFK